ncbi:MAG: FIG00460223: hypothetical protein [uncultured Paraburkholderia sp.]|nr:MAG: FIG00460223: hypothetical protein [uncultured Paraburkholderia sp.]
MRTLLYGGNANLYHVAVSEYGDLLDMLSGITTPDTRVIPAIGPDYGKMLDQARILAQTRYRTAIVLPLAGLTTSEGVEARLTRVADTAGMPLTLYVKSEDYVDVETLARLVERGTLLAVKYAIVRKNPSDDPYLRRLLEHVPGGKIVSGMGERPALVHMREFGLAAWTTGSGCIAPRMVMGLLRAVRSGDSDAALTFSQLADMGPLLPLLSSTPSEHHAKIADAARTLLSLERDYARGSQPLNPST